VNCNPVINCTDGSILGYKYFNFSRIDHSRAVRSVLNMKQLGVKGRIDVMIDSPWERCGGKKVGSLNLSSRKSSKAKDVSIRLNGINSLSGKHAVYFVFSSAAKNQSMCEIYNLCLQR